VISPDGRWKLVQFHDHRRGRERLRLYRLDPFGVEWLRGYFDTADRLPDADALDWPDSEPIMAKVWV
jgi:hypothetical protein